MPMCIKKMDVTLTKKIMEERKQNGKCKLEGKERKELNPNT